MSSSFWLLRVESREFSKAEKERTACKAGQIHFNFNFYYCSVNHQSGLQRNTFSKFSYIFLMHQNVPQIMSFRRSKKFEVMKVRKTNITRICFRLPCTKHISSMLLSLYEIDLML